MNEDGKLAMKVLLLKNYPSASPSDFLFVDSFLENIRRSCPGASLDICCIANGETIPALSHYGLVVLSGGRVNLLEHAKPPWVLQVLDMIRGLASENGGPKLLGICWGHQAVHYALGGKLDWLEVRPRVSLRAWRGVIGEENDSCCPDRCTRNPAYARRPGSISTPNIGKSKRRGMHDLLM